MAKKILLLNGPNLALLGTREPQIYGTTTLADIVSATRAAAEARGWTLDAFQSDVEGELVAAIGRARGVYDGIILNPAAYTHTSVEIADAFRSVKCPVVEVHISNVHKREEFRHFSYLSPVCMGVIAGFGLDSYRLAIEALINANKEQQEDEH